MAARLSFASTESDYVPATVPFQWEAAPGRPANLPQIMDAPPLPLPPGRRLKDGPFSRPTQSSQFQDEAGGINLPSRERRSFNLKYPGSSKKPFLTSQKPRKIRQDMACGKDTLADDIFSPPVPRHRFRSKIASRVLVEFQKRCLPHRGKSSSSHKHHHTCRRLDSMDDSYEVIRSPAQSIASESPHSSSSSYGHGQTCNSRTRKELPVPSSRFMASMLMSLCPDESDDSDEGEAAGAEDEVTDDCGDETSFSGHLTMPRAPVSSPDAIFQAPQQGIVVDPRSPTVTSQRTRAWVDMSRCMSESLHKELPRTNLCEDCSRKLQQQRISLGTDDNTTKSGQSYAPKVNVARRSTSCNATPAAEPSLLQRNSVEEQLELNQTRTFLQNQPQVTAPTDFRNKDNVKQPSASTVWVKVLKSTHAATHGDSDDESDNDSDISSIKASEWEITKAVSQTPSVLCNFNPSLKPATWEISEKLLKSSSLLKYKQQQQQRCESSRSSFMADQEFTTLPSPDHDSKGADLAVVPTETSKSNYHVMNKVAQWEAKAGVGSSGKSLPIYLSRRRGTIITSNAISK